MAKRGSTSQPTTKSAAEPPKVFELCHYCKVSGQVGAEVLPYSFAKGDKRWLHREPCMGLAWNLWKSNEQSAHPTP
jgi:hypothetical protein